PISSPGSNPFSAPPPATTSTLIRPFTIPYAVVPSSIRVEQLPLTNNIAIAPPTTLMVVLRTVANLWRVERQNRNAEAIADRAGKLYDKFVSFVGDMQNLGTRLGNARACYDDTMNKLATGNGNVVRQIEQLKEMGAKASKSIPTALIEKATVETLPASELAAE
ncbi:MAG: DNA recombination protein RmuC, partial [Stellaceae bacterium]